MYLWKYGLIGILGICLDFLIFFLLREVGIPISPSSAVGYLSGTFITFILNAFFNFRVTSHIMLRMSAYFLFASLSAFLSAQILSYVADKLDGPEGLLRVFVVAPFLLAQFLFNRLVTFRLRRTG